MQRFITVFCIIISSLIFSNTAFINAAFAEKINVFDAPSLQRAMQAVKPGDNIILNPGYYQGNIATSGHNNSHFYSNNSGTKEKPIVLKSYDINDQQTLLGKTYSEFYGLYITGDYWKVENVIIQNAQKGIVLDHANYNVLNNIKVWDIGEEAIHIRDSSQNNIVSNCLITDTGKAGRLGYGEGVYIGSDTKLIPNDLSSFNRVGGCQIGPRVTGELFDIKENTIRTFVESNLLIGDAIAGIDYHYADSLIDIKGDSVIVRHNTFDDKGNTNVTHGIHALKKKTHVKSYYYNNHVTLNAASSFIKIGEGKAYVSNTTFINNNRLVQDYSSGDSGTHIPEFMKYKRAYTGYQGVGQAPEISSLSDIEHDSHTQQETTSVRANNSSNAVLTPSNSASNSKCKSYTLGERLELDLNQHNCITFTENLKNKTVHVWDSDIHTQCDFRGRLFTESTTKIISKNYQKMVGEFEGNTLNFNDDDDDDDDDDECVYLLVRVL